MRTCASAIILSLTLAAGAAQASVSVRAVHASPNAPTVDVLVNNSAAFTSLSFRGATSYASLPGGNYNIKVVPAGGPPSSAVIDADLSLADNTIYSVAAVNFLGAIEPLVLIDNNTQIADRARIRFVHASPDAPAVDIALAGGAVLFPNVSFRGNGGYIEVPGGVYDLEVRLAGESTVVLPLPGVGVANNIVYTVWAMGSVAPGSNTPLEAVITVDQIPTPGALALLGMGGLLAARRRR
jgi:hypothetical protein